MRKLTIFEFTIIGFFASVIISTFLMYITSTGFVLSEILGYVSLVPVLNMLPIPPAQLWLASFFFFILVYTLYSLILAIFFRNNSLAKIAMPIIVIVFCFLLYIEYNNFKKMPVFEEVVYVAPIVKEKKKNEPEVPPQYFGSEGKIEARGDLNGDEKNDVAFIINRKDGDRGMLFYMVTSIASTTGYVGSNLVFLGNKVEPTLIKIEEGMVKVEYKNDVESTSTTTKILSAKLNSEGVLEIIPSL